MLDSILQEASTKMGLYVLDFTVKIQVWAETGRVLTRLEVLSGLIYSEKGGREVGWGVLHHAV
jgi:hypothetical protein